MILSSDLFLGSDEHAFEHAGLDQAFHGIRVSMIVRHCVHGELLLAVFEALQDEANSHLLNIDISNDVPSHVLI